MECMDFCRNIRSFLFDMLIIKSIGYIPWVISDKHTEILHLVPFLWHFGLWEVQVRLWKAGENFVVCKSSPEATSVIWAYISFRELFQTTTGFSLFGEFWLFLQEPSVVPIFHGVSLPEHIIFCGGNLCLLWPGLLETSAWDPCGASLSCQIFWKGLRTHSGMSCTSCKTSKLGSLVQS